MFRVLYISVCAFFSVSLMFFIFAVNCVLRDYDSENKLLFSLSLPFVSESNHSILSCGPIFTRCFGDLLISSGALRCAQERNLGVCWDFSSVYSRVCVIGQRGFIIFCFSMFVFSLEKIFYVRQSLTRPLSAQDTRSLLRLRLETFFSYVRSFLRMFLTQSRAIDTNWLLITAHICSRDVPTDYFF